jgi:hypothetical protein
MNPQPEYIELPLYFRKINFADNNIDEFAEKISYYLEKYPNDNILYIRFKYTNKQFIIDEEGNTLLNMAIHDNDLDVVKLLIHQFKVNPNLGNMINSTPLSIAVAYAQIAIIDILIDSGADINYRHSVFKYNLLSLAACSSSPRKKLAYLKLKLSSDDYVKLMNESDCEGNYPLEMMDKHCNNNIRDEHCYICITPIGYLGAFLKCGHNFHVRCITKHLSMNQTCPICNKCDTCDICNNSIDGIRLYSSCNHQFHPNCLNKQLLEKKIRCVKCNSLI